MLKIICKKICDMLGVELNEEFELEGYGGKFHLTENGLIGNSGYTRSTLLGNVLTGTCSIKKLPFKPKLREEYWLVDETAKSGYFSYHNDGDSADERILSRVTVYRTEEEVKKVVEELGWKKED